MFLFIAVTSTPEQVAKNSQGIKSENKRLIWNQKQAVKLAGYKRSTVQEVKASWERRADNHSSG